MWKIFIRSLFSGKCGSESIVLPLFTHERQGSCQPAMDAGLLPSEMHWEVFKAAELEGTRGLALPVRETQLNKLNTLCSGRS